MRTTIDLTMFYLDYFHHTLDKMVRHFVRNRLWTLETFVRNVLCEQNWTKIFWRVTFSKGISFQISFVLSNLSVNPICEHQRSKDLKLTNLFPLFSSRSTMFSHISLLNLCKCRWIRLIWTKCPFWNGENALQYKLCKVKMWSLFFLSVVPPVNRRGWLEAWQPAPAFLHLLNHHYRVKGHHGCLDLNKPKYWSK